MVTWLAGNRIRGTSTERLNTSGIGNNVGGWKELGRTTLGSAGDNVTVANLANKRYIMYLFNNVAGSGTVYIRMQMGNGSVDTGSNYAGRDELDGGGDVTATSQSAITTGVNTTNPQSFNVGYISNYATKEKLLIDRQCFQNTAGAGTAPRRIESAGKWVNTSNALNYLNAFNAGSGDFGIGSELVVLGWDPSDTHTDNFWEELASETAVGGSATLSSGTITAKKYLWVQYYMKPSTTSASTVNFNNDSGTTYAYRISSDGGADSTLGSTTALFPSQGAFATPHLCNLFIINNTSTEKLIIGNTVHQSTAGAGTAPAKRDGVFKWANTSAQITEIDVNTTSGTWNSGSILKVWGHD